MCLKFIGSTQKVEFKRVDNLSPEPPWFLPQTREVKPHKKTDVRPTLVAVGLLLAPDGFQTVLDADDVSKSTRIYASICSDCGIIGPFSNNLKTKTNDLFRIHYHVHSFKDPVLSINFHDFQDLG